MNLFNSYEKVLQECLQRVLEDGETVPEVVSEHPEWQDQLKLELETALWLADQRDTFEPRSGFVASTREHLISQLKRQGKTHYGPLRSNARGGWIFSRFVAILFAVVMVFLSGGSVALAADSALPGDALYPIRRGVENFRLLIVQDEVRDAELHLQYAQEYLVACAILISQGRSQDARQALQQYDRHISGTSRILLGLSESNDLSLDSLFFEFNRTLMQDIEIFQVLLPDTF